MARSEDIKTPLARLSFVNLLTPGKKINNKTKKEVDDYNCNLLFPKATDLSAMKKAAADAAIAEWGDKAAKLIADGVIKSPFLDGDGKEAINKKTGDRYEGFEGTTFLRVGTQQKPKLVNKKVEPIVDKEELYSGCYAYAVVHAFTWANEQNGRGVSFGLSMVQVVKDGDRLGGGGGGDPDAFFEKIEDDGPTPQSGGAAADASSLFG